MNIKHYIVLIACYICLEMFSANSWLVFYLVVLKFKFTQTFVFLLEKHMLRRESGSNKYYYPKFSWIIKLLSFYILQALWTRSIYLSAALGIYKDVVKSGPNWRAVPTNVMLR